MKKSKKIIISAAITGAIHTPTMSPYFPASPEQIAQQAIDAARAGAAVVHIHARRSDGMPVGDFETFRQILTDHQKREQCCYRHYYRRSQWHVYRGAFFCY